MPPVVKFLMIMSLAAGFAAGKMNLDEKIKDAMHAQNVRLGKLNAKLLADELIGRKAIATSGE